MTTQAIWRVESVEEPTAGTFTVKFVVVTASLNTVQITPLNGYPMITTGFAVKVVPKEIVVFCWLVFLKLTADQPQTIFFPPSSVVTALFARLYAFVTALGTPMAVNTAARYYQMLNIPSYFPTASHLNVRFPFAVNLSMVNSHPVVVTFV